MRRGTTPVVTFTLPFDVEGFKEIWVTFAQNENEVFTVEKEGCELSGNVIRIKLTQEQTLAIDHRVLVEMQIRLLTLDGTALASDIMVERPERILKEGVIE